MEECFDGGWRAFGFRNQGQCVRFVQTGKDARDDDSGAGTSACVEMTLNAGTTYLLVARAKYPNATGSYRAQITFPTVRACGD